MDIRKKNAAKDAEEKMYTKEELGKAVDAAVKNARSDWDKRSEEIIRSERDDAARLAAMKPEEREKAEFEKSRKAFDEEKNQYLAEKMEFEAAKMLSENKLPITFAGMLAGKDTAQTTENIEVFKNEFFKAVEQGISERLKGGSIRTGNGKITENDPFLNGFGC